MAESAIIKSSDHQFTSPSDWTWKSTNPQIMKSTNNHVGVPMHTDTHQLSQQMKDCIEACWACAQICNTCSDDMIGMDHKGDTQLMERCIRLCRECADICVMSAQWMSRMSPVSAPLCRLCAEVCDLCAEACEQHAPHHALCGPCAQECRQCADRCRSMASEAKAA